MQRLRLFIPHLRLSFQLTLAPIFLWGALLSGGALDWHLVAAFFSLHLFLYPAATAFNSAYDKDEGPIGGLEAPPPVPDSNTPWEELYREKTGQLSEGGVMEMALKYRRTSEKPPRHNH